MRYQGEQDNLEAEMHRIVALTREAAQRKEKIKRELQARQEGYLPIDEWQARAEEAREQQHGHRTYPEEWSQLASEAGKYAPERRKPNRGRRTDYGL